VSINNQPPIQQVYVQLAPRQPTNGLAIAGLATRVVGAALSLIPLLGVFLCWLPALLAITFGSRSVPRSARYREAHGAPPERIRGGHHLGICSNPCHYLVHRDRRELGDVKQWLLLIRCARRPESAFKRLTSVPES